MVQCAKRCPALREIACKLQNDLQNAAGFPLSGAWNGFYNPFINNNLTQGPDYGSRVARIGCCPISWHHVFCTLKALKAGGDLPTRQESLE